MRCPGALILTHMHASILSRRHFFGLPCPHERLAACRSTPFLAPTQKQMAGAPLVAEPKRFLGPSVDVPNRFWGFGVLGSVHPVPKAKARGKLASLKSRLGLICPDTCTPTNMEGFRLKR